MTPDLSPLGLLRATMAAVPVVRYALGLVGIAAALFLIRGLLPGVPLPAMLPLFGGSILLMALLVVLAAAAKSTKTTTPVASVFLWATCLFAISFMAFTISAVAVGWPQGWARLILPSEAAENSMIDEVRPEIENANDVNAVSEEPSTEVSEEFDATQPPTPQAHPLPRADASPPRLPAEGWRQEVPFDHLSFDIGSAAMQALARIVQECENRQPRRISVTKVANNIEARDLGWDRYNDILDRRTRAVLSFLRSPEDECHAEVSEVALVMLTNADRDQYRIVDVEFERSWLER